MKRKTDRVAFDTSAIVYFLDRVDPYVAVLDPIFERIRERQTQAVVSVITEVEAVVRGLRYPQSERLQMVYRFLDHPGVEVVEVTRRVGTTAAAVRAETNLKLPDAIIVATALLSDCDAMVGNDQKCAKRVRGIRYIYLEDAIKGTDSLQLL